MNLASISVPAYLACVYERDPKKASLLDPHDAAVPQHSEQGVDVFGVRLKGSYLRVQYEILIYPDIPRSYAVSTEPAKST